MYLNLKTPKTVKLFLLQVSQFLDIGIRTFKIAAEISKSYTDCLWHVSNLIAPFVTVSWSSCGHLYTLFFLSFPFNRDSPKKKNLTLHFTLQSSFQVCYQMQLSFEEKSVVTGLYLQKLCGHLVHDEIKEKKRRICDCVTSLFFTNNCSSI